MQVRLGYQQSLRPCQGGLTLNMDTAASAFLAEQPVLDFLLRTLGCRDQSQLLRMDAAFYRKANKAIQSVKVLLVPYTSEPRPTPANLETWGLFDQPRQLLCLVECGERASCCAWTPSITARPIQSVRVRGWTDICLAQSKFSLV